MEETDMCHPTPVLISGHSPCAAKLLTPRQRLDIGVQALAGNQSITGLADQFEVSRKFVSAQADLAQDALADAFASNAAPDDEILFCIPVTKAWLRQMVLGLTLICHSSYRGVIEFSHDLLHFDLSLGTVSNIVHAAVEKARSVNLRQTLVHVDFAGLDEIFQNGKPVLVGAHINSTYCFLLSSEERRDADTWGVRLLDLQPRGFAPKATIADFGTGLRAGQRLALGELPCRGDLFHVLAEITPVVTYLDNRAYDALGTHHKLQQQKTKAEHHKTKSKQLPETEQRLGALGEQVAAARQAEATAIALADEVTLLAHWLHYDVFAVSGLAYEQRRELYDFLLAELKARQPLCPHRIAGLCTLLSNHRDELLAFACQLDRDLAHLAAEFDVPTYLAHELLDVQGLDERTPRRWQKEAVLRSKLGHRFYGLSEAVRDLTDHVVRASSVIENLNSRLRPYFFLRRQLGPDYLALLQFFLNHRRFPRSEHPERVGKSPTELLTGESHPHWLEILGYQRFSQN